MLLHLFHTFIFMLVSPAYALYTGLKEANDEYKRWLLIIFITFYGSIILIAPGQDGAVHWERVYGHYVGLGFSDFVSELVDIIKFQPPSGLEEDAYIHIVSFVTGSILGLPQLFFVFVSLIYAYFFVGSLMKVFQRVSTLKYHWLFYAFAVTFILWKNIEGINTVRTWTGFWILFYGAFNYFETRKVKYLFFLALPPLVHVGFFIMVIPAWVVVLLGPRVKIYAIAFLISFVTTINQNAVVDNLNKTEVGQTHVKGYYIEEIDDYEEKTQETLQQSSLHKMLFEIGVQNWGINIIAFLLIFSGAYFRFMSPLETNLFSIGLLTKILANYSFFLYALANRSAIIAGIFILGALLMLWKRGYFASGALKLPRLQKTILLSAFLLMVPFLLFRTADLIYFVSVYLVVFPFIPWIDNELNMSIRDAVEKLL